MDNLLNIYRQRLPWHGKGTDDLCTGLHTYPASELIKKAIIQHNAKHSIGWLVYDVDSPTAYLDWQDHNCPAPNIAVINKQNGHAHFLYGLKNPVHKYDHASRKALKYCAAVDVALTIALEADPGYIKYVSKNPAHDRWLTLFPRNDLYSLKELEDYLTDYMKMELRQKLPPIALGRNVTLFETLRQWAYAERRTAAEYEPFFQSVLQQAVTINAGFPVPLPHSEVKSTAKSVSKWTWRNMNTDSFHLWSKNRRQKSIYTRKQKAQELAKQIYEIRNEFPELTQRDIAAMLNVCQKTVSNHLRIEKECLSDITDYYDNRIESKGASI